MKVGFVGLGNMGGPISMRLLDAGHTLVVTDLRPEVATEHLAKGATWADSPAAVAAESEVVFASLPGPDKVEAVALGPNGVIERAPAGSIFVNLSTIHPARTVAIGDRLAERGIAMLDAPVSGSTEGSREGTLVCAVGGEDDVLARARPLLETFASTIVHTGALGTGGIAKIVHNMASSISRIALGECLTLAAKAGIEPPVMLEVLKAGSFGKQRVLHSYIPKIVLTRDVANCRGALQESLEVSRLAVDLAREYAVPVQLATIVSQEILAAVNRGWGTWDAHATFLLQEERAGVELHDK